MAYNASNPEFPDWLERGDNAWQLTAATLVSLQSIPGLLVLYAGLVKSKWAINTAFMCLYAFSMVLVCWVVYAYRMAFGVHMILGLVGRPGPVLSIAGELSQGDLPEANIDPNFPKATMVYFQFAFAAITLILIAGSFLCRMNFRAWMVFVPLWLTFSYTIGAFSIWGGGWAFQRGVIDYSGGYVIHVSSGTAGAVGAWWIGPRHECDLVHRPNNIMLTMIGAGILWVGWNGFNGGDPYNSGADASAAVLNTNITTAVSLLTWTFLDIFLGPDKKPSVIGSIQGMITGLVAITPAAGVIAGWAAIIFGIVSGAIPWVSMNYLGRTRFFIQLDDYMGVFHTHLVAGTVGGFMVGIFATKAGCAAFALTVPGGAIEGNGVQVGWQLAGSLFIIGWNVVWTSLIMMFIKYVCRIPLRMSEEEMLAGDDLVHGESAYTLLEHQGHDVNVHHGSGSSTHATHTAKEEEAKASPRAMEMA